MAQLRFYERKSRAYKMVETLYSKGVSEKHIYHNVMKQYGIGKKTVKEWLDDFEGLGSEGSNEHKPRSMDKKRTK